MTCSPSLAGAGMAAEGHVYLRSLFPEPVPWFTVWPPSHVRAVLCCAPGQDCLIASLVREENLKAGRGIYEEVKTKYKE